MSAPGDVAAQKSAMRAALLARRSGDPTAGDRLAALVLSGAVSVPAGIVSGVWPLPGEMDLRPLLHALHARGHVIVLPETPPRGERLRFRLWSPGCPMVQERFGTWRPDGDTAEPDTLFVPLLAFDRTGARLGYGGGYYDRTLAALPGHRAIGFGFAAQEVPQVPTEPHDRRLETIVTENEVIFTSAADRPTASPVSK